MRILQLTLANFRPFREQEPIKFAENVTVIAGVNGRGKTAILDALALLLQRFIPQITDTPQEYRYVKPTDVHANTEETHLEMAVNCAGIPVPSFAIDYNINRRRTGFTELPNALKHQIQTAYGPDPSRSNDAAPIAVYYTTDRAAYRLPRTLPERLIRGQRAAYRGALVNRTVDYKDFVARFRVYRSIQMEQSQQFPEFVGARAAAAVLRAFTFFLEEFSDLGIPVPSRLFTIELVKGRVPLTLPQLSEGERAFVAVVLDLCRRLVLANPELANPLEGQGVVLIDELELHLHPKWQREAIEKLRTMFPRIQFICTTHSPFIIQTLRPDELIDLDGDISVGYAGRGVEEVARFVMGVESPEMSPRYREMLEVAREFFNLLEEGRNANAPRKEELRQKLAEMTAQYTDNPAYQALLEQKRLAAGL